MCAEPADVNLAASGEANMGSGALQISNFKINLSLMRSHSRRDSPGVESLGAELRQTITKRPHLGLVSLHDVGHFGARRFS